VSGSLRLFSVKVGIVGLRAVTLVKYAEDVDVCVVAVGFVMVEVCCMVVMGVCVVSALRALALLK